MAQTIEIDDGSARAAECMEQFWTGRCAALRDTLELAGIAGDTRNSLSVLLAQAESQRRAWGQEYGHRLAEERRDRGTGRASAEDRS